MVIAIDPYPNVAVRGERPTTTISRPSHINLIFSSKSPRNPCPSNIVFYAQPLQIQIFF